METTGRIPIQEEQSMIGTRQFHIRPLCRKDIEILGDLYFPWSTKEETIAKWTRYLEEQQQGIRKALIVLHEDEIVGYGHLLFCSEYPEFKNNNIPEIQDLWIFEDNRKKGIGSGLIRHLEKLAAEQGYKQVGIGVGLYRDYGSAQKLYSRLGFAPDGHGITYKHAPVVAGEKYPVDDDLILWLTKHLS